MHSEIFKDKDDTLTQAVSKLTNCYLQFVDKNSAESAISIFLNQSSKNLVAPNIYNDFDLSSGESSKLELIKNIITKLEEYCLESEGQNSSLTHFNSFFKNRCGNFK